ncbi:MAG: glycosyltransferase, partial [Pseudomonadota bacterium]
NDTKVIDHWLDRMLDLFQQPDTGIVGARLVYADGSLQEAGGVVFSDGSGWNYGRNDEADRPQYSFVSETDYVSGACLMLRRTLFESLNGFDSYYSPAYYEDTDLCFRVRAQGLKVMYQPAATVVHFEGVTSGTDESGGTKRYQVINREKFIQRWQAELSHQPESPPPLPEQAQNDLDHNDVNPSDRVRQLRYHRFAKRALIIDAVTPTPDQDSGSVRMFALLKLFGQIGYQTSFMPSNLAWAGVDSVRLQQAGIEVLTAPWVNDVEEWLVEHGRDLNLVLVSRHYILTPLIRLIRHYCPNAQLLFDTVDLHFLREEREAEVNASAAALREAARTRRAELSLIERSDATLVVSGFEARLLNELKPEARVQVVSNVHSLQSAGNAWADRRDVLFVGGFQHPPNRDAAFWLIEEILPQIREHLPEVKLHLIGSKMPDAIRERRAPGLIVHGFVADLEPYLNTCRVSLAPLRYGAGVKGKVNQAMSHGLPVVATTCAAEGMYTRHEHDVLMADTADDFAEQVVRLYQDQALWEKIAANGRDNVEQHFSVAAAERALSELLRELES